MSTNWVSACGSVNNNNNNHACWATGFPGQVPDSNGPQQAELLGGEPYRFRYRPSSDSVVTE